MASGGGSQGRACGPTAGLRDSSPLGKKNAHILSACVLIPSNLKSRDFRKMDLQGRLVLPFVATVRMLDAVAAGKAAERGVFEPAIPACVL